MNIPDQMPSPDYTLADHRAAFEVFLSFVKANIAGQTALRIDPHWCTQAAIVQGFAIMAPPDLILREEEIGTALPALALSMDLGDAALPDAAEQDQPFALGDVHDAGLDALIRDVYQRDFDLFGFADWKPD